MTFPTRGEEMRMLDRKFDRADGKTYWGYDLEADTYLQKQFIMTDCNLQGLSDDEALRKLYGYRGYIETFLSRDDLFERLRNKKSNLPRSLK